MAPPSSITNAMREIGLRENTARYCSRDQWAAAACFSSVIRVGTSSRVAGRIKGELLGPGLLANFRKDLVGAPEVVCVQRFGRDGLSRLNLPPAEACDGIAAGTRDFFDSEASVAGEVCDRFIGSSYQLTSGRREKFLLCEKRFRTVLLAGVDFFAARIHGGDCGIMRGGGDCFQQRNCRDRLV